MPKKEKLRKKIEHEGYDLYSILGFEKLNDKEREKLSKRDISKNFARKLKKYHPDRVPRGISKEERAEYNAMFNLVKKAGAVLTDSNRRKAYDMEKSVVKSSGYFNQQNDFKEFIKMQEREVTEEGRRSAELEFKKGLSEFKQKHGADKLPETAMTIEESKERFDNLDDYRDQEDIELMPTRMEFKGGKKFDHKTFMKAFERDRVKRARKKGQGNGNLMSYDDIGTFNESSENSGFGINDSYGDMYNDRKVSGNNQYGGISDGSGSGSDSDDLASIDSDDLDEDRYTADIPMSKSTTDDLMNARMAERDELDTLYKDRSVDRFESSMNDKFGVSAGLGFMVGTDKFGDQIQRKKYKHQNEDEVNAYRRMLGVKEEYESESESEELVSGSDVNRNDGDNGGSDDDDDDDDDDELVGVESVSMSSSSRSMESRSRTQSRKGSKSKSKSRFKPGTESRTKLTSEPIPKTKSIFYFDKSNSKSKSNSNSNSNSKSKSRPKSRPKSRKNRNRSRKEKSNPDMSGSDDELIGIEDH